MLWVSFVEIEACAVDHRDLRQIVTQQLSMDSLPSSELRDQEEGKNNKDFGIRERRKILSLHCGQVLRRKELVPLTIWAFVGSSLITYWPTCHRRRSSKGKEKAK